MVLRQIRYEWVAFWRNPAAAFFTFVFPLLFLVIFNMVFGNAEISVPGGTARASTFYVPAIAAMSIVNACFTSLAMSVTISRDAQIHCRMSVIFIYRGLFEAGGASGAYDTVR